MPVIDIVQPRGVGQVGTLRREACWYGRPNRLRKLDGNVIEIDKSKLSSRDVAYIDQEHARLTNLLTIVSVPVVGIVRDDAYKHVYGFESLTQLEEFRHTKPLTPELSADQLKQAGVALIPVGTKVEVWRTHAIENDGFALEISPIDDAHTEKPSFIISIDFSDD